MRALRRRADGLHAADVDVAATLDVLAAMAEVFPQLADAEPAELHERQVVGHRQWAESFNAWRRSEGLPGPGAETCWPCREPAVGLRAADEGLAGGQVA